MASVMSDSMGPEQAEPTTLEGLFACLEVPLLRYAARLLKDRDAAQEIVQESFMRLHAQFNQVQQPRPWLYRTVHNLALNHIRGGKKIVSLDEATEERPMTEAADGDPLPGESMSRRELIEQTRGCLDTLAARDRELLLLKFEEHLSYREMSERTGLSVSNVGFILHHALKRLAAEFQKAGIQL